MLSVDASMKVSLDILQRVYEVLQGTRQGQGPSQDEEDSLDPDDHLYFIDAYDMPLWNWSNERSTFERSVFDQAALSIRCDF
jgi:DNA polymerase epsilon subunit 2